MSEKQTPVYYLGTFSQQAKKESFYIESLRKHLSEHAFVSDPHKHDHYLVLYITHGGGTHTIDFETYPVHKGSFFVMTPGQVHSWKLDEDTDGYIIFFERAFSEFNVDTLIQLEDNSLASLDLIVKEMYHEKDLTILRAWLDVLLLKLSRHSQEAGNYNIDPNTFKIRKLLQLIDKNFVRFKKPSDYGNLMNLSPAYLNNICKKHLGKTLSDLINERVVLEAKRLFAYADLTVSQVSHKLKFSDPSYFIRFFRKNTGITPERFKESTIRPIQ